MVILRLKSNGMRKVLLVIIGLVAISCKEVAIEPTEIVYSLSIDSILVQDGTRSLDVDPNGFYILKLDSSAQTKQTVHRITGIVLQDSLEPWPPAYVNWESSHTWITGDTVGYIVRRIVNTFGQWVIIDTNYINVPSGLIVPTVNPTSISGKGGEVNTMIAPIYGMKGDTMIVSATLSAEYLTYPLTDTVKILLR